MGSRCIGRRPNIAELNLAAAGIATDKGGFIRVDDKLETTVAGIHARGGRSIMSHLESFERHRRLLPGAISGFIGSMRRGRSVAKGNS